MTCRVAFSVGLRLLCATHRQVSLIIILRNETGLVVRAGTVNRIMRGHVMAPPFPLSDRASDVRPGCKTQRIAPTLRQVADLMCARMKERGYFKTCIVGHVNCCLQCAPTLRQQFVGAIVDFGNTLFSLVRKHAISKRRSYPLCISARSYVSGSVGYGKEGCHYVTTHIKPNSVKGKNPLAFWDIYSVMILVVTQSI
ncbi:hypothetical protein PoB_003196400 [Plakobranchus ocellatus]|uniref:Uncharacterized protein n=1 Tax=Plakobranchus ocellatus TaxID=259542 RepID=A0AAV4AGT4_9GAST|nr:hypothetical protein PoB_003196400 [Plakobranchus ocellatus]